MMTPVLLADTLKGITYFVVAASAQSFTAAAEELGITKSAIGKSIRRLEEKLGTPLFHRTTRKISLTSEGETYLTSCLSALDTLNAAELALRSNLTAPCGTVRIDMPTAFGHSIMMPILLGMTERYPHLKLTVTFNDKVIDPLDAGFDLAIRFGSMKDHPDLVARQLNKQHLILCASPGYQACRGVPNTLEDLAQHRCVMAWRGGSPLSWLIKGTDGRDVKFNPTPFHQISDGDAMIEACIMGAGIVQFPELLLRPFIEQQKLKPVLSALAPSPTELNVIWPRSRHLLPGVRFIVDELLRLSAQNAFN